jgi:hypothetical protein
MRERFRKYWSGQYLHQAYRSPATAKRDTADATVADREIAGALRANLRTRTLPTTAKILENVSRVVVAERKVGERHALRPTPAGSRQVAK